MCPPCTLIPLKHLQPVFFFSDRKESKLGKCEVCGSDAECSVDGKLLCRTCLDVNNEQDNEDEEDSFFSWLFLGIF